MKTALFTKLFSTRDLHEACTLASEIGYDAVELMGRDPHLSSDTTDEQARALSEHLDDLDLDVSAIASYTGYYIGKSEDECREQLDEMERFCELAEILGTDMVRHGPGGPPAFQATDADYEEGADWLRRAADRAEEYDIELLVEIHGNTIVESAPDANRLLDQIDRENVGVIHDAGNMFIRAVEHGPASIETLGDRLSHVHVKDELRVADTDHPARFSQENRRGTEYYEASLLGEGEIDQGAVFDALARAGYDGYITDECHTPPSEAMDDRAIAAHEHEALQRLISEAEA